MANRTTRAFGDTDKRMLWIGFLAAAAWWVVEAAIHSFFFDSGTIASHLIPRDSNEVWMRSLVCVVFIAFGVYAYVVTERINRVRAEQQLLQHRLEGALTRALSGFLPICANCKKIRLERSDPETQSSWQQIERYLVQRTDVQFSHSVCPACEQELLRGNLDSIAKDWEI